MNKIGQNLEMLLAKKNRLTGRLNSSLARLVNYNIRYSEKSNEYIVSIDFKKELNDNRPTVAQKEAWIDNQLNDLVTKIKLEEGNVEILKNRLKVVDSEIKFQMKLLDVFTESKRDNHEN